MKSSWLLPVAAVLIIAGAAGLIFISSTIYSDYPRYQGEPYLPDGYIPNDFESNGERIYFTGLNETGKRIEFTGGPQWLYVHGGSCVSCHGVDARGGTVMMRGFVTAPDITYQTLTQVHDDHLPYTEESIKRAIRDGIDPAGNPLDWFMPRWRMTDQDMDDLIEHLKTL
ncbi:conserved hypothetical protein [Methanosalsum zhilinae DSM 4017]|uniref:Cytochrome c domain-containing protein n=1 Tax=Methanosalsum zhilinae (strain DSM 4017 / NBRC 107636 / OCM 62 / WeN5) TaxID=679901 RepID=F7XNK4_METZD|nr:cytochrome c [Methanosalsum zhilinae]AEH60101.1 conserved hypothetical protein [Methanosalsum zhilinae DSM 4017]